MIYYLASWQSARTLSQQSFFSRAIAAVEAIKITSNESPPLISIFAIFWIDPNQANWFIAYILQLYLLGAVQQHFFQFLANSWNINAAAPFQYYKFPTVHGNLLFDETFPSLISLSLDVDLFGCWSPSLHFRQCHETWAHSASLGFSHVNWLCPLTNPIHLHDCLLAGFGRRRLLVPPIPFLSKPWLSVRVPNAAGHGTIDFVSSKTV